MKWLAWVGSGAIFGFGLAISGMVRPEVVLSFLLLEDLGLLFVMGVGSLVALLGFWLIPKLFTTAADRSSFTLRKQYIDKKLVYGSALFGIGWGITGICPGAGIASLGVGNWPILWAFLGILIGVYAFGAFEHYIDNDNYG